MARMFFLVVAALYVGSPQVAYAQCPNDTWGARNSAIFVRSGTSVGISTQTVLVHTLEHQPCGGNVKAKAVMVGQGDGPCTAGPMSGTHTSAQAFTNCNSLVAGTHWTHGYHYWESTQVSESDSTTVELSGTEDPCEGGCEPGYTTDCQGDQQPDECGCCVNYTPIVLDLGRRGVEMSNARDGVMFQINDTGSTLMMGWPVQSSNPWLFLDRNGDGLVNDGSELFGNTTRLRSGQPASNGYEALAELDSNGDRVLDELDTMFGQLRLWHDADRDGVSIPSEIHSLAEDGVVALSLDAREMNRVDRWGNRFRLRARVTIASSPGPRFSYDVYPVTAGAGGAPAACSPHPPSIALRKLTRR